MTPPVTPPTMAPALMSFELPDPIPEPGDADDPKTTVMVWFESIAVLAIPVEVRADEIGLTKDVDMVDKGVGLEAKTEDPVT